MNTTPAKKSKSKDSLGDRMKGYERMGVMSQHMPFCPIIARMDGRSFHSFTKGLKRPYDERLSRLMIETTRCLITQSNALIGYTQSDEITLVFSSEEITLALSSQDQDTQIFFDGKHDKIVSILASITTGIFNRLLPLYIQEKAVKVEHEVMCVKRHQDIADGGKCTCKATEKALGFNLPMFDARAFSVPNLVEAANCLVWREQDATRNSVQMAARSVFSHNECHKKNRSALMDMLHSKGINWNDYPAFFKRGSYLKRQTTKRFFEEAELAKIPVEFRNELTAREIVRSTVAEIDMPPYSQIENRVSTYFGKTHV